jgi:hypothetical protein
MKPERDIRQLFHRAAVETDAGTDGKVLAKILAAHETTNPNDSAVCRPNVRSTIMRSPITKFAIAAAVAVAVLIGISQLGGPSAGVAWGEVAGKVNASPGVSFRTRTTGCEDPNDDWPNGYVLVRRSPVYSRTDWYRDGQIRRIVYVNRDAQTVLWVAHDAKVYQQRPLTEQELRAPQDGWTDPRQLVDRFLSGKYEKLGRKTIDGILCEGIETMDAAVAGANFPVQSFVGRMWVSVETSYPVLIESEIAGGHDGNLHQWCIGDQFQWDIEVGASECEVAVPPEYRPLD